MKQSSHNSSKQARVYEQRKVKHATCKNVKGKGLEDSNAIGDTDVFVVVPIGGAIVHHVDGDFNPRRVTVARVHGGLHP